MGEILNAVVSWKTFVVALLVFGFAPGAVLRLIVLAFDRGDPRRAELFAELHAVRRWERPFWVFEQLEVALFEGIAARLRAQAKILFQRRRRWQDSHKIFLAPESFTTTTLSGRGDSLEKVRIDIVRPDEKARQLKLSRRVPRIFGYRS